MIRYPARVDSERAKFWRNLMLGDNQSHKNACKIYDQHQLYMPWTAGLKALVDDQICKKL